MKTPVRIDPVLTPLLPLKTKHLNVLSESASSKPHGHLEVKVPNKWCVSVMATQSPSCDRPSHAPYGCSIVPSPLVSCTPPPVSSPLLLASSSQGMGGGVLHTNDTFSHDSIRFQILGGRMKNPMSEQLLIGVLCAGKLVNRL